MTEKECDIYLFFGEYHQQLKETLAGRLSERKATKLVVYDDKLRPNPLTLTRMEDHFRASFSWEKLRAYHIVAVDDEAPVVDLSQYRIGVVRPIYYAHTFVPYLSSSGSKDEWSSPSTTLDLLPFQNNTKLSVGKATSFQIRFKAAPLSARAEVRIYAPNGWSWEGDVKEQGKVTFIPEWPGLYVVEVIVMEETLGEYNGKKYEAIRHRATLTLEVPSS